MPWRVHTLSWSHEGPGAAFLGLLKGKSEPGPGSNRCASWKTRREIIKRCGSRIPKLMSEASCPVCGLIVDPGFLLGENGCSYCYRPMSDPGVIESDDERKEEMNELFPTNIDPNHGYDLDHIAEVEAEMKLADECWLDPGVDECALELEQPHTTWFDPAHPEAVVENDGACYCGWLGIDAPSSEFAPPGCSCVEAVIEPENDGSWICEICDQRIGGDEPLFIQGDGTIAVCAGCAGSPPTWLSVISEPQLVGAEGCELPGCIHSDCDEPVGEMSGIHGFCADHYAKWCHGWAEGWRELRDRQD